MFSGLSISLYSAMMVVSSLVSFLLASRSWFGTKISFSRSFALFQLSVFVWSVFKIVQFEVPTTLGQLAALRLQYVGIVFIPASVFSLARAIARKPIRGGALVATLLPGFIFLLLVATDPYFHFFWKESSAFSLPVNPRGAWGFQLFMAYTYIHVGIAYLNIVRAARASRGAASSWTWRFLCYFSLPFATNIVFIAFFPSFEGFDPTPIAFAVSGILISIAKSRFDFMDVMPYAKDVVLESINTPLVVADSKGFVIGANEEANRFFPEGDSIEGRRIAELFPVLEGVGADEEYRDWSFGETEYGITCYSVKRGPELWRGKIFMFRDVTARVRAQREAEEARIKADAANAAKSAFVATVSHELRNPLNAIISLADLNLRADPPEAIREDLEVMLSSGNLILGLVNDLLDLSKIEAGRMELETVDFDIREKVVSVLRAFRPAAEKKGLFLDVEVEDGVPRYMRGDPLRYGQVLMNLVSNAIKFTERGAVTVDIAPCPDPVPGAAEDPRSLCILASVRDTGMGIAAEKIPLLFREFSQLDSSVSRRFGGTGLGLSICKKLVELFGGELEVSSVPGEGSLFSFTARFEPAETLEAQARCAEVSKTCSLRVLVVDDDPINTAVATRYLEKLGHSAVCAATGASAIEAAASGNFDIALLDLGLSDMDGFEACLRIRMETAARPQGELPIAAMTARTESGTRAACAGAGMVGLLPKPIDPGALDDLLRSTAERIRELGPRAASGVPVHTTQTPASSAPAHSEPGAPLVDRPALLERLDDDEAFMRELLGIFIEEAPGRLLNFDKAVKERDLEALQKQSHALKGSSLSLCANPLGAAAGALEAACIAARKAGAAVDALFPDLADRVDALVELIGRTSAAAKELVG
jgi:signal transduction histidine kinase/CheY-like chemotaxis protein/HPt (histidine-containing phosphotransfer) domain-containing protein